MKLFRRRQRAADPLPGALPAPAGDTSVVRSREIVVMTPEQAAALIRTLSPRHLRMLVWLDDVGRPVGLVATRRVLDYQRRLALADLARLGLVLVMRRQKGGIRAARHTADDMTIVNHASVRPALDLLAGKRQPT